MAEPPKGKRDDKKESKRDEMRRRQEEAAAKMRQTRIDSGDLIVTRDFEFEASASANKSSVAVEALVAEVKRSKTPVLYADACEKLGIKYPEDFVVAMSALEKVGLVRRFDARSTKDERPRPRKAAFLYVG